MREFVKARGKFMPAGNALDRAAEDQTIGPHRSIRRTSPFQLPSHRLAGARSQILVCPCCKEQELVGAIAIFRQEVRPFTDKQIELVTNFAAQAVIAIENTRLLTELRQRTDDLTESLEQQTATSEVLRVISSSPGELEPVFQAMLKNATHICEAKFGILYSYEAEKFRTIAMLEVPPAFAEWLQLEPRYWDPTTGLGRLVQTKKAVHIPDVQAERLYLEGHPQRVAFVQMTGVRTFVAVPLLKDDELIGSSAFSARKSARSPISRSSWSKFRRAGRHRNRERAPAQRIAPTHRRFDRVVGAADHHRRHA